MAERSRASSAPQVSERALRTRIFKRLAASSDELAAKILEELRSRIPAYPTITDPEGLDGFRQAIAATVPFLAEWIVRGEPSDEQLEAIRAVAARRADQLIPLDVHLVASHIVHRAFWDRIVEEAGSTVEGRAAAVDLLRRLMEIGHTADELAARTYLAEHQHAEAEADRAKRDLFEDLLGGRLPLREGSAALLAQCGIEPDDDLEIAVAVVLDDGAHAGEEALRASADAITHHLQTRAHAPLVVVRHEEVLALVAIEDEAPSLTENVGAARTALARAAKIDIAAGVGTVARGIDEVQRAHEEAHRALRLARSPGGPAVVELARTSLLDYLISQADATARRIVPAEAKALLQEDTKLGGVLIVTLMAYLEADLNVGRAADILVVHPNTVHYRLRRIGEVTGRSTRSFSDLVDLLCAVRLSPQD